MLFLASGSSDFLSVERSDAAAAALGFLRWKVEDRFRRRLPVTGGAAAAATLGVLSVDDEDELLVLCSHLWQNQMSGTRSLRLSAVQWMWIQVRQAEHSTMGRPA